MFDQAGIVLDRTAGDSHTIAASSNETIGLPTKLRKHRLIYTAGDDANRLYEVVSGAVMLYRILDDGRRQVVEVVFPGGIFGLAAGETHQACAETLMPSVVRSF